MSSFGVPSMPGLLLLRRHRERSAGQLVHASTFVDAQEVVRERPPPIVAVRHCIEGAFSELVVVISRVWVGWSEIVLDIR